MQNSNSWLLVRAHFPAIWDSYILWILIGLSRWVRALKLVTVISFGLILHNTNFKNLTLFLELNSRRRFMFLPASQLSSMMAVILIVMIKLELLLLNVEKIDPGSPAWSRLWKPTQLVKISLQVLLGDFCQLVCRLNSWTSRPKHLNEKRHNEKCCSG